MVEREGVTWFRDPGSPVGPLPGSILDGLRLRMGQTSALLSRDFPQAIQGHGPNRPAGRLESQPASPTEGMTKA
jgi:hypothetical protein